MRNFQASNRLRQHALYAVAREMNDGQIKQLQRIFNTLDADQNGIITMQELQQGLAKGGTHLPDDIEKLFMAVDSDGWKN